MERTVSSRFDYIERLIETRQTFTVEAFAKSVDAFLSFQEFKILKGNGTVSREQANRTAEMEYEAYNRTQPIVSDFDRFLQEGISDDTNLPPLPPEPKR